MNRFKILTGLTESEVAARTLAGQTNAFHIESGKSIWRIIADNVFNLFLLINSFIAVALIVVGSYTNALFMVFVLVGVVSGIVVELRARNIVNHLTLLNKSDIIVIRDGNEVRINPAAIVLGDVLKLVAGDQIPADATVVRGTIEANEALLTGEPDLIVKKQGQKLLSGSFVTSGQCYAEVRNVGADNYVTKLALEAKVHKPIKSEILGSIATLTRFTSCVVLPLGFVLLLEALLIKQDTVQGATVSTAAALLGMLPKGLVVLTIIALITAVFKLGRKKVLVQEIYSVETMARIDMLCLDKTGTLTDSKMRVCGFKLLSTGRSERRVNDIIGSYVHCSIDNNSTMDALRTYFAANQTYQSAKIIPFSSDRKWGAIYFEGIGMVVMGAPERIFERVPPEVTARQHKGRRILGLGIADKRDITSKQGLLGVKPIAMIEFEDGIRKDAKKTLTYLRKQGIDLCIISGDNPVTVSKIAERAGFADFENYLDVSALSESELRRIIPTTAIFGRVSPHQKRFIIREMKATGKTVAMTGDGVNDILALREADLSIVMAEGDSAAKQISNIVLLESSFSDLPDILFEGRRVVNNMFRVASLFFIKTLYSFFVAVLCALSPIAGAVIVFPFIALQITAIDQVLEGYPTFFMSFESDKNKVTKNFLRSSLLKALPQAIMIAVALAIIFAWTTRQGWDNLEMATLMYHVLGTITLIGLFRACLPFSKLRAFLFATSALGFYVSAFILGRWFSDILQIDVISDRALIVLLIIGSACIAVAYILHRVQRWRNLGVLK